MYSKCFLRRLGNTAEEGLMGEWGLKLVLQKVWAGIKRLKTDI